MRSASFGSSSIDRTRKGCRMLFSYASWRWLIDDGPENAQFFDGIHELMKVNWLHYVCVHAEFVACHHVPFLFRRGEHNYRNHSQSPVGLNLLQHLQAIYFGEFQIQQHDRRIFAGAHLVLAATKE